MSNVAWVGVLHRIGNFTVTSEWLPWKLKIAEDMKDGNKMNEMR